MFFKLFNDFIFPGSNGQEVRLISIPKFSSTSTVILLNLRTLECETMSFSSDFPDSSQTSPDVDK